MRHLGRSSWFRVFCTAIAIAGPMALGADARAAGTSPDPPKPPPPRETTGTFGKPADAAVAPGRAEAEESYAKGWETVEEAKKELADGKTDSAKKRFGKALKKFKEAVEYDPTYFQAWNMVGYCSRKSGDLKRAFEAYGKCLELEPEYAEAHEYLGEAHLMNGDVAKAKEQLLWLVSRKSEEAAELAEEIEAYEKARAASKSDSTHSEAGER